MSRSVRGFAHAVPSHAVHRMAEASMIYGQLAPRPTNLTEIPVFIGKKKTVRWGEGPANKEEYDLTSKFNTSWQNFIVRSDLVGQRKIDKTGISRPAEAQIARRDVEPSYSVWYKKLYLERSSALFCAGICLVWLCGCYTLSIIGLNRIKKA
jgi:hypothetical protein